MKCEVCSHTAPAPVTDPWHFKLDAFILEGLREHSMLSYLWCLHGLAEEARVSFFFLEPHELFYTEEAADKRKPDAEIDMLTVGDGVVRLCEIKAANRGLDIAKFAAVAKRIRPNIATLAVMEPRSSALSAKLSELETALGGTGIAAELILPAGPRHRPKSDPAQRPPVQCPIAGLGLYIAGSRSFARDDASTRDGMMTACSRLRSILS